MTRIEDYALIGDLQTAALVERGGSVDWLCFPRFDSGACFAALLGGPENGRWLLEPVDHATSSRRYLHDTMVLETTWETKDGVVRVFDFMPPRGDAPDVVRIVEGVEASVLMHSELVVRFDYGRILPWVRTQGISMHWIRHTTLTWVERNFGYAVARAYAGHTDRGSDAGATTTYVRATVSEVATALAALTGEPHPLAMPREWPA